MSVFSPQAVQPLLSPSSPHLSGRADRAGPPRSVSPPFTHTEAGSTGHWGTSTVLPLKVEVCPLELHDQGPGGGRLLLTPQPLKMLGRKLRVEVVTLQQSCVLTCKALPLWSVTHFTSPTALGGGSGAVVSLLLQGGKSQRTVQGHGA